MKYMLALLVLVLGLEGIDRALLERRMESLKPPLEPTALRALTTPPHVPTPPPPPPPPSEAELSAGMFP